MKPLTPLFVFLFPFALLAGEPHWQNFTQEETVLIAHIDFAKVDVAQTLLNNQSLVESILKASPMEVKNIQTLTILGETGKAYLTKTLGIQEAYIVVNFRLHAQTAVAVVLPQSGSIKVETLQAAIALGMPNESLKVMSTQESRFIVITGGGPGTITDEQWNRHLEQIIPLTPTARPEFAEAFKAMEDAPIKIAASLPGFVRKVVKDTAPKLPPPFDKLDIVPPLTETRSLTVGIEPAKPSVHATMAMTSEFVAQNTQQTLRKALEIYLEKITKEFEQFPEDSMEKEFLLPIVKEKDRFGSLLSPLSEGKNLVLRWEKAQFEEIFSMTAPLMTKTATLEADRMKRRPCSNHIKQLVFFFHNYHDVNDKFPPPFTVDANGKPLHSWRVLALPYIGQSALYNQIRLNEPWDSAHNKQFHDKMPSLFRCPVSTLGNPKRDATYCMVVGTDTVGEPNGKGIHFSKLADGTSNTILLVERKTPVCWMEPTDVLQEHAFLGVNKHEQGIGSEHEGGVIVGFADGSSNFMKEEFPLEGLKILLMKNSGRGMRSEDWSFFEPIR